MNTSSYPWLKQLEASLATTSHIPLWGLPPAFPLQEYQERLSSALGLQDFSISLHQTKWLSLEEISKGFGSSPLILSFALSPLEGSVKWILSQEDVAKLTTVLLSSNGREQRFSDKRFQEGFYHYVMLQAIEELSGLGPFEEFSIALSDEEETSSGALCIDIRIEIAGIGLWGRIVCPDAFLQAFRAYFSEKRPSLLSSELAQEIFLTLNFEIGKTTIPLSKWEEVKRGDFILLDKCSYDLEAHKGTATVFTQGISLFHAKLKDHAIKILDYAFYYEEDMDKEPREGEEESFFEESPSEENEQVKEDFLENEEHLWSSETEENPETEKMLSTRDVPVTLTVEVAKLKITLNKLLELKPGNTIELQSTPAQGVYLTLEGKTVAKGELVKIGEALGVKILDIG